MKKCLHLLLISALAAILGSCIKEDSDNRKDCPKHIRIVPEWVGSQPRVNNDALVNISVYPDLGGSIDLVSGSDGVEVDLTPGWYDIVGWETINGNTSLNRGIVSVVLDSEGMATEPDPFFAGSTRDEVLNNLTYQVIPLPIRPQTRELIIMVQFSGALSSSVSNVEGILEGIAVARDVSNGFPSDPNHNRPYSVTGGKIGYSMQPETIENSGVWFTDSKVLLGIDGDNNQSLKLTLTDSQGTSKSKTVDVTGMLTGFHTQDLPFPWHLVLHVNIDLDFEFSITDWQSGGEFDLTAN